MARPYWKGYLKLSLVNCPVSMMPATSEAEKVKFHTLNKATSNRVVSQYIDSVTGKPVKEEDERKGYERGDNDFVLLDDSDLDAVALDSNGTIDIEMFVPSDSVQWVYLEKPHYLLPADPVGNEPFSVIREAMKATKTVGISRLVIGRRERAVMLEPRGDGIVLWSLRYADEVRPEEAYFEGITEKPDTSLVTLVQEMIKERKKPWSPSMAVDPVQDKLLEIIAAKKKAIKPSKKTPASSQPAGKSNVIDIMAALKQSLEAGKSKASH